MFKKPHHLFSNYPQNKAKPLNAKKTHGDVWQDNNAVSRVRGVPPQPVTVADGQRTRQTDNKNHRSQNSPLNNKLYQVAFWTERPIREQIIHIAKTKELSISRVTDALVKYALAQHFEEQQQATLPAVISQAVSKPIRTLAKRMAGLLIRIAFDTGQIRVLATNILGRQPGMTEAGIKEIFKMGDNRTKANLTRRTPQLKELEDILEKYLLEEDKTEKEGRGE